MRKSMAATKAKEKEMKDEKEAERLVRCYSLWPNPLKSCFFNEFGFTPWSMFEEGKF